MLAFRRGSVPEIVDPGVTGAIVDTLDEAIAAMPNVLQLNRRAVRRRFERRFSATRMAQDYVGPYRSLIAQSSKPGRARTKTPIPVLSKPNGSPVPSSVRGDRKVSTYFPRAIAKWTGTNSRGRGYLRSKKRDTGVDNGLWQRCSSLADWYSAPPHPADCSLYASLRAKPLARKGPAVAGLFFSSWEARSTHGAMRQAASACNELLVAPLAPSSGPRMRI